MANTVSDLTILDSVDVIPEQSDRRQLCIPAVEISTKDSTVSEAASLIISGAVGQLPNKVTGHDYAYAVLSAVMPSLEKTNIISTYSFSRSKCGNGPVDASALLVKFSSGDLPTKILKEKHKFTAFNTHDLDSCRFQ